LPPRKGILQYMINAEKRAILMPNMVFLVCADNVPEEIKEIFSVPLRAGEVLSVSLLSIDMLSLLRGRQIFSLL
jgi:uncharacterized protein YfaP (DUF2135 family)